MKLYTRTGDDGTTGLFGGGRVGKDHPRVEAYGTVDEANAHIGLAATAATADAPRIAEMLFDIQSRLFDIGADLATPADSQHRDKIVELTDAHVRTLEDWIDEMEQANTPMTTFILPGGSELSARLHVARTVCRRSERCILAVGRREPIGEVILKYLNRLSDLLFAMARQANVIAGVEDVAWSKNS